MAENYETAEIQPIVDYKLGKFIIHNFYFIYNFVFGLKLFKKIISVEIFVDFSGMHIFWIVHHGSIDRWWPKKYYC